MIPIFLSEISPPAFRSTFTGVGYQMGTMVSSASAQIEAGGYSFFLAMNKKDDSDRVYAFCFTVGGEHQRTTIQGPDGPEDVPNYAFVQGIFIGCVAVYVIALALVGPENHGSHFERSKMAFQAGASKEDVGSIPDGNDGVERSSTDNEGGEEKGGARHFEAKRPVKDALV